MEVVFGDSFKKVFKKKIIDTDSENEFWTRLELFIANPFDAKLKTHKLSGKLKNLWSFSIEYDVRVIFYFNNDKPKKAVFVDIGNHDEVY
ncbi:MAG TPA: type II toxin-antitoxin system YafQ family toxin [Chitinophagales bacterium]|jgi:mRNA-degrading endonuclease YafQ of YafQ-DinJ toxin-antitoxin module|nr:type II toxin-antitoxin system YafQ family toxin [Chitinophagales bacterium]HQG37838.1 type II toxin-antitoxin system YafQ family toxin [Chitinophagales bacterium]